VLLSAQSICGGGACALVKGFIFQLEKRRRQMFIICRQCARGARSGAYFGAGNRQDLRKLHSGGGGLDSPWPPGTPSFIITQPNNITLHARHIRWLCAAHLFSSLSLFMLIISLPPLQSGPFLFDFAHFEFN
jgi:hypothetical protein